MFAEVNFHGKGHRAPGGRLNLLHQSRMTPTHGGAVTRCSAAPLRCQVRRGSKPAYIGHDLLQQCETPSQVQTEVNSSLPDWPCSVGYEPEIGFPEIARMKGGSPQDCGSSRHRHECVALSEAKAGLATTNEPKNLSLKRRGAETQRKKVIVGVMGLTPSVRHPPPPSSCSSAPPRLGV